MMAIHRESTDHRAPPPDRFQTMLFDADPSRFREPFQNHTILNRREAYQGHLFLSNDHIFCLQHVLQ
jgi:hypothetical protein